MPIHCRHYFTALTRAIPFMYKGQYRVKRISTPNITSIVAYNNDALLMGHESWQGTLLEYNNVNTKCHLFANLCKTNFTTLIIARLSLTAKCIPNHDQLKLSNFEYSEMYHAHSKQQLRKIQLDLLIVRLIQLNLWSAL